MPRHLRTALLRSSMLVVIASSASSTSIPVARELTAFRTANERRSGRRSICVVAFASFHRDAIWKDEVAGVRPIVEEPQRTSDEPSVAVLSRIVEKADFVRRSQRQYRVATTVVVVLSAAMLLTGGLLWWAHRERTVAVTAQSAAVEARRESAEAVRREQAAIDNAKEADRRSAEAGEAESRAQDGERRANASERLAAGNARESLQEASNARERAREAKNEENQAKAAEEVARAAESESLKSLRSVELTVSAREAFQTDRERGVRLAADAVRAKPTADAIGTLREQLARTVPRQSFLDDSGWACVTDDFEHALVTHYKAATLEVWSVFPRSLLNTVPAPNGVPICGHHGRAIVVGDDRAALWHLDTPDTLQYISSPTHDWYPVFAGFSSDETSIWVLSRRSLESRRYAGRVERYDLAGRLLSSFALEKEVGVNVALMANGVALLDMENTAAPRSGHGDHETHLIQLLDMRKPQAVVVASEVDEGHQEFSMNHEHTLFATERTLWSVEPLRKILDLPNRVAFSPDESWGLSLEHGAPFAKTHLLDYSHVPELNYVGTNLESEVNDFTIFPRAASSRAIGVWIGGVGGRLEVQEPHSGVVMADWANISSVVKVSPDGRRLFSLDFSPNQGGAFIWNLFPNGVPFSTVVPYGVSAGQAAFTADGRSLVADHHESGGAERLEAFDWEHGRRLLISTANAQAGMEPRVERCASGGCVVVADGGSVRLSYANGDSAVVPLRSDRYIAVAASGDGTRVGVAPLDGRAILLWSRSEQSAPQIDEESLGLRNASHLAFTPDGTVLAVSDRLETVFVDPRDGHRLGAAIPAMAGAFDPSGERFLAVGVDDKQLRLWERKTSDWSERVTREFPHSGSNDVSSIVWSADGKFAVTTEWRDLKVWDTTLRNLVLQRSNSGGSVLAASFLGASTRVVSLWTAQAVFIPAHGEFMPTVVRVDDCDVCVASDALLRLADERFAARP